MIWNINCRKTRRLLALWAGSDLEQRECQVAERHVAVCPKCREVWERLQQSQQVLEKVRPTPFVDGEPTASLWPPVSIWPAVARHIRSIDEQVVRSNWRDWLPTGAVAAACLGIIAVTLPESPMAENVSPSVIMSYPAAYGSNPRRLGPLPRGLHREGGHDLNELLATPGDGQGDDDPPSF